jgi:hypothetical protein
MQGCIIVNSMTLRVVDRLAAARLFMRQILVVLKYLAEPDLKT